MHSQGNALVCFSGTSHLARFLFVQHRISSSPSSTAITRVSSHPPISQQRFPLALAYSTYTMDTDQQSQSENAPAPTASKNPVSSEALEHTTGHKVCFSISVCRFAFERTSICFLQCSTLDYVTSFKDNRKEKRKRPPKSVSSSTDADSSGSELGPEELAFIEEEQKKA